MKVSSAGRNLIKKFEGLRLFAYCDPGGTWSIGYGHVIKPGEPSRVTGEQAEAYLDADLAEVETQLNLVIHRALTQNQFDSLASFVYNLGIEHLLGSTLLAFFQAGNDLAAANQFVLWDHCGGTVLQGLRKRREAERELFLKDGEDDSGPDVA